MGAWPKRCTLCERKHGAGEWSALSFVGYQAFPDERLEMRNCPCGNTLVFHVEPVGLPWTIAEDLAQMLRNDAHAIEDDELVEANRLYDIADALQRGVDAFRLAPSEAA